MNSHDPLANLSPEQKKQVVQMFKEAPINFIWPSTTLRFVFRSIKRKQFKLAWLYIYHHYHVNLYYFRMRWKHPEKNFSSF